VLWMLHYQPCCCCCCCCCCHGSPFPGGGHRPEAAPLQQCQQQRLEVHGGADPWKAPRHMLLLLLLAALRCRAAAAAAAGVLPPCHLSEVPRAALKSSHLPELLPAWQCWQRSQGVEAAVMLAHT
jgi:hypothetical protein